MSNAPYQIRTTYLDGTMTRDMIENFTNDPARTVQAYILNDPVMFAQAATVDVLNLDNKVLYTFDFQAGEERHTA